jgi:hypothetical protein
MFQNPNRAISVAREREKAVYLVSYRLAFTLPSAKSSPEQFLQKEKKKFSSWPIFAQREKRNTSKELSCGSQCAVPVHHSNGPLKTSIHRPIAPPNGREGKRSLCYCRTKGKELKVNWLFDRLLVVQSIVPL